jgi:hypothetical protein
MAEQGQILRLGAHAAGMAQGRVIAVFARSFYLADESGRIVCAGGPELGDGPLNAIYAHRPPAPDLGDWVRLDARDAAIWRPDPWPAFDRPACRAALARVPRDKGLLAAPDGDPFRKAAQAPLAALAAWRSGPVPAILKDLLGLGPGLTPSGDDALGGAVLALHATGRNMQAEDLAAFLVREAPGATSAISAAHLRAAAEGMGAARLHDAIADLLRGRVPEAAHLDGIGHSSGWDAMAGIIAVLAQA